MPILNFFTNPSRSEKSTQMVDASELAKPSPRFMQKLEKRLRLAYRHEFAAGQGLASEPSASIQGRAFSWLKIAGYGIPLVSGALVLSVVVFNMIFPSHFLTDKTSNDEVLSAFDQGQAEEQLLTNFEKEMDQVDQGITLALAPATPNSPSESSP